MKQLLTKGLAKQTVELLHLVGDAANERGWRAYLVGGPVRDLLLGEKISDIDIAVEGDAIELGRELAARFKAKMVAHPKFGTCTIAGLKSHSVDLATARKETYAKPAAYPDVEPSTLRDDLFRRDFTINAMAMSINKTDFGDLIDYFGGKRDIDKHLIRVLHDKSFIDDPTRILRAARFAKRFGFGIEPRTGRLMAEAVKDGMLELLGAHRVRKEALKSGG